MTITWQSLWFRLRQLWRLHRTRFRYCYTCGVVLTADETTTCVGCIEQHDEERAWFEQQADAEAARHAHSVPSAGVMFLPPRAPANQIGALQAALMSKQQNAYNQQLGFAITSAMPGIDPAMLQQLGTPGAVIGPFTSSQLSGILGGVIGRTLGDGLQ